MSGGAGPRRVVWSESLSVNNDKLDSQHQTLFETLNRLYDLVDGHSNEGGVSDGLREVIDRLDAYAAMHFIAEEGHMKRLDYPDFDRHREMHADFRTAVSSFRSRFEKGGLSGDDLVAQLERWLFDHITVEDKRYASWELDTGAARVASHSSTKR